MASKNNQPGDAAPSADTTGSLQADSLRLSSGQAMRRQAEAKLSERKKKAAALPAPETDTQRLVHELEVHQIELEMQNEELVQSRTQVEMGLRQYTDLYDFAPVGYFTLAHDGAIHQVNLAGANLLGAERGALIKRRFGVFVSARSRTTLSAFLEKVFSTSGSKETCEIALQKDGPAPLWVYIEAMTEDGQRKTCRAVVVDITERKRVEEALRDSETLFRKLFEDHAAVKLIIDPDTGNIINANEAAAIFYGWSYEQLKQMKIQEINTLSPEEIKKEMEKVRAKKKIYFEFCHRRADGSVRDVDVFSSKIEVKGKDLLHSIVHDITDHKRAEEALKESENKYRLLADNVNDVIFVLDMNMNYTYISPSVKILNGYEPEEMLKQSSIETLTPSSRDLAMRTISEIVELEKFGRRYIPQYPTLNLEMMRKDGTTVWTEVKFSFIRDENQQSVSILGVIRDITRRKWAEEELQRTLESLRKAFGAIVQVLVSAVETRDPYTSGHQIRSADLARAIATEMGLPRERIEGIRMAGSIHDIGKMSVPTEILSRPTKLTELEFSLIKEHARRGFEILKDVASPWPLAEIVYQHHERMDGSGYPRGLKGDEIIMEARILAVADVVEAMASHRPYRPALGSNAALAEIENNKGTLYDADVVDACLRLFRGKGFQLEGTRL